MSEKQKFCFDVAKLVLLSVSVSFALTLTVLWALHGNPVTFTFTMKIGLLISIFVPAVISGPTSYFVLKQKENIRRMNDELNRLVRYDPLTSVLTRRIFFEDALAARKKCLIEKQPCAVFFIDIDHFKSVNDTHGHAIGDAVLERFGTVMRDLLKPEEILGRIGGEEFCIFAAGCDEEGAHRRAEVFLNEYRAKAEYVENIHVSSTISIGISVSETDDLDTMISAADAKLYRAKSAGRDCFIMQDKKADKVRSKLRPAA